MIYYPYPLYSISRSLFSYFGWGKTMSFGAEWHVYWSKVNKIIHRLNNKHEYKFFLRSGKQKGPMKK